MNLGYLPLDKKLFPDKFDYEFRCIDRGEDGMVLVPPMLDQPFAENAIRHGRALSVEFEMGGEDMLKCTITEDGAGQENAKNNLGVIPVDHHPHTTGITGIRPRLSYPPGTPSRFKIVYSG